MSRGPQTTNDVRWRTAHSNCVLCGTHMSNVHVSRKHCNACARQKNIDRTTEYRREIKRRAVEYLGGKCIKCGYCKSIKAFDFHHKDPSAKDFTIGQYQNLAWHRIQQELDKCDLLCANCHRELHETENIPSV